MEFIRGLHNVKGRHRGCVATIGNFDGVHRGHQAVIGQVARQSMLLGLPSTLITFEPQPREHFQGKGPTPSRLTRLREKIEALRKLHIDRMLCLKFDRALAELPAETFVQRILIEGLAIRYLVVGDDFRFGARRSGDFSLLQRMGRDFDFGVEPTQTLALDGQRVSSTWVREALVQGDMELARRLLGRPYQICGRVAHGEKIGRTLGVPTANIRLQRRVSPVSGVFVVEVHRIDGAPWPGVASVGTRPVLGGRQMLLEVHLFDFSRDMYGAHVQVDFLHKLRDELNFDSLDELKQAMGRDIRDAREWLSARDARHAEKAIGNS